MSKGRVRTSIDLICAAVAVLVFGQSTLAVPEKAPTERPASPFLWKPGRKPRTPRAPRSPGFQSEVEVLRRVRKALRMTTTAFAAELGISRWCVPGSTCSTYEDGLSPEQWAKVAELAHKAQSPDADFCSARARDVNGDVRVLTISEAIDRLDGRRA